MSNMLGKRYICEKCNAEGAVQQGGSREHHVLRRRDEAQGSEAAPVVGLSPAYVVGRPLVARATGGSSWTHPAACVSKPAASLACELLGTGEQPDGECVLGDQDALLLPAFADPHLHLVACAAGSRRTGPRRGTRPPRSRSCSTCCGAPRRAAAGHVAARLRLRRSVARGASSPSRARSSIARCRVIPLRLRSRHAPRDAAELRRRGRVEGRSVRCRSNARRDPVGSNRSASCSGSSPRSRVSWARSARRAGARAARRR